MEFYRDECANFKKQGSGSLIFLLFYFTDDDQGIDGLRSRLGQLWQTNSSEPEGSMCPNSVYLGLEVVLFLVLWGQSIYYLGTGPCGQAQ